MMLHERTSMRGEPRRLLRFAREAVEGASTGVTRVLNFALLLEHLEAEFYSRGLDAAGLLPAASRDVFDQIRKHELAHVQVLSGLLGGDAAAKPAFDFTAGGMFGDVFSNASTFMMLAQAFEDTGVRAYKGQAASIMTHRTLLRQALQIHSVEARHAAQVRRMRGQKPWIQGSGSGGLAPSLAGVTHGEGSTFHFILAQPGSGTSMSAAFDEPLTMGQVLALVSPFIAGGR